MPRIIACGLLLVALSFNVGRTQEIVIPLRRDETNLVEVKANPHDFVRREITLTGVAKIGDYYNYKYRDAQRTHYSIVFKEATKPVRVGERIVGERIHLYLKRDGGREIAEKIASAPAAGMIVRVKATIRGLDEFRNIQWDMLELLDIQFRTDDRKWGSWNKSAEKKAAQKRIAKKEMLAKKAEERRRKDEAAKKAAVERARWHNWLIKGKRQEARFMYAIGDKVQLQRRDGTKFKVSTKELAKDDLAWIKKRRRSK